MLKPISGTMFREIKNNLRKISKSWASKKECLGLEHNPPRYILMAPGDYEWTCSACGTKTNFTIVGVSW